MIEKKEINVENNKQKKSKKEKKEIAQLWLLAILTSILIGMIIGLFIVTTKMKKQQYIEKSQQLNKVQEYPLQINNK